MHYVPERDSYRSTFPLFPLAGVELQPEVISMPHNIISITIIIAYKGLLIHLLVRILPAHNNIIILVGTHQSAAVIVHHIQLLYTHDFPVVVDE